MFSDDPHIDHIAAKVLPENLDEDMYIFIYRKQHAVLRHEIFNVLKNSGGRSADPAK